MHSPAVSTFVEDAMSAAKVNALPLLTNHRNIGIFGLSANPPTGLGGHAGIVRHLVREKIFDEIWILPVYRHSYAAKSSLEKFEHRVQMCIMNFEPESTAHTIVTVKSIERDVYLDLVLQQESAAGSIRMGTIDVIKWVRRRVPLDCKLSLILGSDTYRDLSEGRWKQADALLSMVQIHAIRRPRTSRDRERSRSASGCITSTSSTTSTTTSALAVDSWRAVAVHHQVPGLRAVSSSKIRHQTIPRIVLFPPLRLSLPDWLLGWLPGLQGRRLEFTLFSRTSSDQVLESDLHPDVLAYMCSRQLYMFSPAAVGKRNRSRFFIFVQLVVAAALMANTDSSAAGSLLLLADGE